MKISPTLINGRFLTQQISGVQRYCREILIALDHCNTIEQGIQFKLIYPEGVSNPNFKTIDVDRLGRGGGKFGGYLWENTTLLKNSVGKTLVNLGNTAPIRIKSKSYVLIHDASVVDVPESYSIAFRIYYRLQQTYFAKSGFKILTVSTFSVARLSKALRIAPSEITNISAGGDHILRTPACDQFLPANGLKPQEYFLIVGAAAKHKNIALVEKTIRTLKSVKSQFVATGCISRLEFTTRPSSEFYGTSIRFLGQVTEPQLRALYENAVALIFPSKYEGFGLPPLEAMYCGCPVIANRIPSVVETVGDAGYWFDGDLPDAEIQLAAIIDRVSKNRAMLNELRTRGYRRIKNFTWARTAQNLIDAIKK